MNKPWIVYTDGACRGNPGLSSAGIYVVSPDGKEYRHKKFLGHQTNNFAEYQAMILALKGLIKANAKQVILRADSQLMIRQMLGEYKVKHPAIKILFDEAKALQKEFASIKFEHVRREDNQEADRLANEAIDEHLETL